MVLGAQPIGGVLSGGAVGAAVMVYVESVAEAGGIGWNLLFFGVGESALRAAVVRVHNHSVAAKRKDIFAGLLP